MKFLMLAFALFAVVSCKTVVNQGNIQFHSTASIPQKSYTNLSDLSLMNKNVTRFAIIAGVDRLNGEKIPYLLLAPFNQEESTFNEGETSLNDVWLPHNVILRQNEIEEFIKAIDLALVAIEGKMPLSDGKIVEFSVSQDQNIERISRNVEQWTPNLNLKMINTSDGYLGNLTLGLVQGVIPYQIKYQVAKSSLNAIKADIILAKAKMAELMSK